MELKINVRDNYANVNTSVREYTAKCQMRGCEITAQPNLTITLGLIMDFSLRKLVKSEVFFYT